MDKPTWGVNTTRTNKWERRDSTDTRGVGGFSPRYPVVYGIGDAHLDPPRTCILEEMEELGTGIWAPGTGD